MEGILLGYENDNTAYHISQISYAKIIITKHAILNENKLPRLAWVSERSPLNLDDFTMVVDEAHIVEKEEDLRYLTMIDEVRIVSLVEYSP
ncbi:hypothetical protein O181_079710 [Austropuccinia psidii MF-1]|uniref:Uncharacterized protein n=1 Tax=Austropuccinia psidii MF-1 TaxID=1389203 RepID=A0A9Q3II72_9BASI|nr:hypothetical protein [Austropuccinia psidii MF-1]